MKARASILLAGILAIGLGAGTGLTRASTRQHATSPHMPQTYMVTVGYGQQGSSTMVFAPKWLDIAVGDTVIWRDDDTQEPHTVTFGPAALLKKVSGRGLMPLPQKGGPPLLAISRQEAQATAGTTYAGTGFATSGLLYKGRMARLTWGLTFTKPGTYRYYCLIHYPFMSGVIVVHPRPTQGKMFVVQAGGGPASFNDKTDVTENTMFFPPRLTIHVGDTVTWIGGFHTVTFGPAALRDQLEAHALVSLPQKSGSPQLVINPKVSRPSGGSTYDGTGFVNSGILFLRVPPGSKAPPMYRLTFTKAGAYEYDCLIHPHMDGTITVLPKGA